MRMMEAGLAGRYLDDWQVGDRLAHDIRRTVTETDNLLYSVMTHNPQPLHIDTEAARDSEFGQILVSVLNELGVAAVAGAPSVGYTLPKGERGASLRLRCRAALLT